MFTGIRRIHSRSQTLRELDELVRKGSNILVIHYSCESFYDIRDGRTPRVTSIAARNFSSGQTQSFSIHKVAELQRIAPDDIDKNYDQLEKAMLDEFDKFVRTHQGHTWCHWNMRDINYGFAAIEHRHRVLGGKPSTVQESEKFDVARALVSIYGVRYVGHPRLESLIAKNKITDMDFLTGEQEAAAFKAGEYVKLHRSTLRKVDIMANILERVADRTLETNATWNEIYGMTPEAIGKALKEHWVVSILGFLGTIIGFVKAFESLR